MLPSVSVLLTSGDGGSFAPALKERLEGLGEGASEVRWSKAVDSLDSLTDVCNGADVVYLLSALELPDSPDKRRLRDFRAGVSRVLECCQTCGVGSLVFMSSSRVVSASPHFQQQGQRRRTAHSSSGAGTGDGTGIDGDGGGGDDNLYLCDEDFPLVTSRENKAAHSIAMAEAEVLKASETQNLGKGVLYTCALRPGVLYGTGRDEPLLRVLSWVGWGLNRVTLRGLRDTKSDMVFLQNLIQATVLAGTKLAEGAAAAGRGAGVGHWRGRRGPGLLGTGVLRDRRAAVQPAGLRGRRAPGPRLFDVKGGPVAGDLGACNCLARGADVQDEVDNRASRDNTERGSEARASPVVEYRTSSEGSGVRTESGQPHRLEGYSGGSEERRLGATHVSGAGPRLVDLHPCRSLSKRHRGLRVLEPGVLGAGAALVAGHSLVLFPKAVGHPPNCRAGLPGAHTRGLLRLLTRQGGGARGYSPAVVHPDLSFGIPVDAAGEQALILEPWCWRQDNDRASCFTLLVVRRLWWNQSSVFRFFLCVPVVARGRLFFFCLFIGVLHRQVYLT